MVSLRLLMIAEHPDEAEAVLRPLRELGFSLRVEHAADEAAFADRLGPGFDAVVLDDRAGLAAERAVELLCERGLDVPVVLVIDPEREDAALAAVQAGAADYVMRDRPRRLGIALARAARLRNLRRDPVTERAAEAIDIRDTDEPLDEHHSLRGAVRAMERVLGVVAHELRTPLAATRAMAEFLLTDTAQSPGNRRFLTAIHGEVLRMAGMVNDLLEVARLNSGTARWNWGEVDLAASCEAALETVRPLLDKEKVSLTLEVEPAGLGMRGDAEAIRRLVLNLVSNAGKFTPQGTIRVRARAADDTHVELEVADTGHGMNPETMARLGEAFALNAGIIGDHYVQGAGLGLAICKGIVAAHGGAMGVDSTAGHGTRVWVRLRRDLAAPSWATGDAQIIRGVDR